MAFFAGEFEKAGTTTACSDDPALEGEPGRVSQLIRRMVWLLYTLKASDLHLNPVWEPEGQSVLCVLRVDGVWREIRRLPSVLLDALIIEWKRLAGFSIEEREHPQEGSARILFGTLLGNLRVAIIPTIHGEKVSVRHIPTRVPTMADLAIDETPLKDWCRQTHGLLLFVGPTGSGKSTTRAACMQEILTQRPCNMMTVEDPVEYLFPRGVTHLKVGQFSMAEGLRALLSHDPDVIFIGEALHCDPELARWTVEFAETGHLVISVMHAHDAISPLWEYLELGVKRSLLAKNLAGIVCQQLAPKPCAACLAPVELEPALLETIRQAARRRRRAVAGCRDFLQPFRL